jgi:hypothetical protein
MICWGVLGILVNENWNALLLTYIVTFNPMLVTSISIFTTPVLLVVIPLFFLILHFTALMHWSLTSLSDSCYDIYSCIKNFGLPETHSQTFSEVIFECGFYAVVILTIVVSA